MPFSEKVKKQVKEMAAFQCCRCHQIGVDVHHITPERDGGPNDIDNAAPLCQNCHDQFGDNPSKRKEIIQMRDWWYDKCKSMSVGINLGLYEQINTKIDNIHKGQADLQSEMADLKAMLLGIYKEAIEGITPETAAIAASGTATFADRLGDRLHANFICNQCNTVIGLLVGSNQCPNCGNPILPK